MPSDHPHVPQTALQRSAVLDQVLQLQQASQLDIESVHAIYQHACHHVADLEGVPAINPADVRLHHTAAPCGRWSQNVTSGFCSRFMRRNNIQADNSNALHTLVEYAFVAESLSESLCCLCALIES